MDPRRTSILGSEGGRKPSTRPIHRSRAFLCWVSRQDDRALAVVLFGHRVAINDLTQAGVPREILSNVPLYSDLLSLAQRIGVDMVEDGSSLMRFPAPFRRLPPNPPGDTRAGVGHDVGLRVRRLARLC